MHKSQIFFYLLALFILGVFAGSFELVDTTEVLILAIAGVVVICLSFKNRFGLLAGFLILVFAFGGWRFYSFDRYSNNLKNLAGEELSVIGYVDNEPEVDNNIQRMILKTGNDRILVTTSAYPRYKFGDTVRVHGKLKLPENFTSSTSSAHSVRFQGGEPAESTSSLQASSGRAEFDYVNYLRKDGIKTTLFFPEIEIYDGILNLSFFENLKLHLYGNIFDFKNKFQKSISNSIVEPNASFINGILLGTRQNIPGDLKEAFNKTGTTHILAISGYNIMIISEAVLIGMTWFFKRRIAFWISVGAIVLFVVLTGASSSVVRAAIMGLLLSFAHGYGRLYDQKNSIILAGSIMVWTNPMVLVFDIGFQLSFAAVFGLIYLYPYINSKLYKIGDIGNIKELTLMTLSAQLSVLPLSLYYFGGFSLFSVPANVLILPFLPIAMFLGFLSGLAGMVFEPLALLIGYVAWAITSYQIFIVSFFSSLVF